MERQKETVEQFIKRLASEKVIIYIDVDVSFEVGDGAELHHIEGKRNAYRWNYQTLPETWSVIIELIIN